MNISIFRILACVPFALALACTGTSMPDDSQRLADGSSVDIQALSDRHADTGALADEEACGDPLMLTAGDGTEHFEVISSSEVELLEGTTLTADPEGEGEEQYMINGAKGGGGLKCRCPSGCSGACVAEVGTTIATCKGTCEGLSSDGLACSTCAWHYDLPEPKVMGFGW